MSVKDVGRLSLNLHVIQHLRIHRGLMPVKCKKLEKGFSYSPDLAKHIRFYTRNTVCKECSPEFTFLKTVFTCEFKLENVEKPLLIPHTLLYI